MEFDRKIPPALLEIQIWFMQIETRPLRELGDWNLPRYDAQTREAIEKRISPGPHLSAAQRIGLYNQQYWFRSFTLLQERYPTLLRLFGYGDFNGKIAEPYLMQHPNGDWLLATFGRKLPQWIEEAYREEDREFIVDIARMEEAYERLWYAPESAPRERFTFHANLFAFREQILQEEPSYWEEHPFPPIDWSETPRSFVLSRKGTELIYAEGLA